MSRRTEMRQSARLQSAQTWLQTYEGDRKKLAKAYRKRYGVDYPTAFRELELLGIEVDPVYRAEVLRSVERQAEARRQEKRLRRIEALGLDSDDLIMDDEALDALLEAYGPLESNRPPGKKRHGHYCWKCGRYRANEKFSGKGHAKHICKECQKEVRQHARQKRKERLAKQGLPPAPGSQDPSSESSAENGV